jgi:phosphoglycerate kinase
MPAYKTLDDLDVAGKRVLVRADLNVPMSGGAVTDTTRLDRSRPTLCGLADAGARVIVLSHFGRPKGAVVPEMSLAPVADALRVALGRTVTFVGSCIGDEAEAAAAALENGDILLLENLRFHAEEEADDADFAQALAKLGDVYVNDAFSTSHRAHASTHALARLLPAAAGRLMEEELGALSAALETPARPVCAVVGGAKVSTKLAVIGHMLAKVDSLIIGGGMANTFLHAQGVDIGASLCEKDMADEARAILEQAEKAGVRVILPTDVTTAKAFAAGAPSETKALDAVADDDMILDVGPDSIAAASAAVNDAETLLWNGPMGAFEIQPFDTGTNALAQVAAANTRAGMLMSVAGGGDTVAALSNAGVLEDFSYVSSAGGAFLEYIEGKTLPGVQALIDAA